MTSRFHSQLPKIRARTSFHTQHFLEALLHRLEDLFMWSILGNIKDSQQHASKVVLHCILHYIVHFCNSLYVCDTSVCDMPCINLLYVCLSYILVLTHLLHRPVFVLLWKNKNREHVTFSLMVLISGFGYGEKQNIAFVQMAGLLMSFTTDHYIKWWGSSFMTQMQHAWEKAITLLYNTSYLSQVGLKDCSTAYLHFLSFFMPYVIDTEEFILPYNMNETFFTKGCRK